MPSGKNWHGEGFAMAHARVKRRALVVDDQPPVATVIEGLLRRVGFDVAVAANGADAIVLARRHEFDVVTLDIDLPDMEGFDVCARLKEDFRFGCTPVIFVSGRLTAADRRRGAEVGGADFISKPFDAFTFVSRVLSHIKSK